MVLKSNSNLGHCVGFLAFLTKVKHISGITKFEKVTYNYGNGYSKSTARNRDASADITKNRSRVVYAYTSRDSIWNSGSVIALLELKRGDSVYLSHNTIIIHSTGTNFMGLIVSPDK
ncbi:hypothetical protein KUTeg_008895 [Tegillarca granosa]|uniref:C1q domain-containing protein n=1 Tax=Tegillarca granosa TaxID=220873 RepID=A0ABQ9FAE4_TEGGR|nr:hypothetical protein KUTeg_008895 [Tegillarca granosa]